MEKNIEHVEEIGGHIVFISKFTQQQALHYFDIPEDGRSSGSAFLPFTSRGLAHPACLSNAGRQANPPSDRLY